MKNISDVYDYLSNLLEEKGSPGLSTIYSLIPSTMTENDCIEIEQSLNTKLPKSYKQLLLAYNWTNMRINYLYLYYGSREIVDSNKLDATPYVDFYKARKMFEIGLIEADRLFVSTDRSGSFGTGEVGIFKHDSPNEDDPGFVSTNLERMIVCSAIDLRIKEDNSYFDWDEAERAEREEALMATIMKEIVKVEPRADASSFWDGFIRGY